MPRAITTLLPNDLLARIERLRINAAQRFTNRSQGEHVSRRGGHSLEFKDYRDYVPGDDVRFVDWNLMARLNRPYLKLYHEEEEQHIVLLVDASASMAEGGKLELALELAAALGVVGLIGGERIGVHVFHGALRSLRSCRGRHSMRALFAFLEAAEAGGRTPLETGIEAMLKVHRGRGVLVILSDFLTAGDLRRALNAVVSRGLEIFALQILAPAEHDPELAGDVRLVDCETGQVLDVSASRVLLEMYQEHRAAHQLELEVLCQQRGGRFAAVRSSETLKDVLFDLLRRRGWVA